MSETDISEISSLIKQLEEKFSKLKKESEKVTEVKEEAPTVEKCCKTCECNKDTTVATTEEEDEIENDCEEDCCDYSEDALKCPLMQNHENMFYDPHDDFFCSIASNGLVLLAIILLIMVITKMVLKMFL